MIPYVPSETDCNRQTVEPRRRIPTSRATPMLWIASHSVNPDGHRPCKALRAFTTEAKDTKDVKFQTAVIKGKTMVAAHKNMAYDLKKKL
jgi:hypothetical protein